MFSGKNTNKQRTVLEGGNIVIGSHTSREPALTVKIVIYHGFTTNCGELPSFWIAILALHCLGTVLPMQMHDVYTTYTAEKTFVFVFPRNGSKFRKCR